MYCSLVLALCLLNALHNSARPLTDFPRVARDVNGPKRSDKFDKITPYLSPKDEKKGKIILMHAFFQSSNYLNVQCLEINSFALFQMMKRPSWFFKETSLCHLKS